ncbi:hypothetical protein LEN26_007781 [Aphanomyces euteiches]|nr:hypothetical protein LEN26_007781 [Aphanomyces euteiches]
MVEMSVIGLPATARVATRMGTLYGNAASLVTLADLPTSMTMAHVVLSIIAKAMAAQSKTPIPTDRLLRTRLRRHPIARLPLILTRNLPLLAGTIAVLSVARKEIGGPTVQPTLSLLKPSLSSNNAPLMYKVEPPDKTSQFSFYSTPRDHPIASETSPSDINDLKHQLLPDSSAPLTNPLDKKQSPYVLGRNIARDHPLHEAKAPTDDMSPAFQITYNEFTARRHHPDEKAPDNIKNPASSSPSIYPHSDASVRSSIPKYLLPLPICQPIAPDLTIPAPSSKSPAYRQNSLRTLFSPRQIEATLSGDFQGLPEKLSLDIEDRLYPVMQAEIQLQIKDIRARRQIHQDAILPLMEQVLGRPITPADLHLLKSPAQLHDPQHWLDWFTSTLNSCEEARKANRDFSRANPIALVTRTARLSKLALSRVQRLREAQLTRAHTIYHTRAALNESCALLRPPPREEPAPIGTTVRFSSYVTYNLIPLQITLKLPSEPFELAHRTSWPRDSNPNMLRTALIRSALPALPYRSGPIASVHSKTSPSIPTPPVLPRLENHIFPFAEESDFAHISDNPPRQRRHRFPCYEGGRGDSTRTARFIAHIDHQRSAPSATILINTQPHLALIDTGAAVSVLSETSWRLLGSPSLQAVDSELHSVEQRPLRVVGRALFSIFIGGLTVEFPLWVMSETITDCIIGVNLLRRLRATINLETNQLIIAGTSGPISLSPLPPPPPAPLPPSSVSAVSRTRVPARSCRMILCSLLEPLPETCTVLIEPIVKSPIQVARSLDQPRLSQTRVQIRNAGDSPFTCLPELSDMPDPHSSKVTDSDPTPVQPTYEPVDTAPAISSLSHHVYPNYIASIQTNPVHNELPINWEGSTLNPTQREMLRKILPQHDIFVTTSKAPGRTDLVKCYINTGSAPPIKQAPYRVSQREGEIMEAEIQQYLGLGLIRPSTSPWASPVLMIRKPDGPIRFCIDYRRLNEVTIMDSYPLPRIDDLLDVLGNAKYFSTMDVASGYWNVRMEEDSIPKTAFTCKFGLYEWLVMPFGLCNAVPQFERLMEHVLRDQIWRSCLVYLDDVIVYSDNFTSHLARVNDVLCCFARAGFKLKMSKCHWGKSSIAFLGHIVMPAGILPNPEKVKSVLKIRALRNVAEVRAFLGLAGYFRRFIKGFAA